ncbi:MFS transporter [Pseudomonas aeruginosa]|nr:MFS transporter [Pseudomonas aeruginosa]
MLWKLPHQKTHALKFQSKIIIGEEIMSTAIAGVNSIPRTSPTSLTAFEDAPLRRTHVKAIAGGMGGQFTDGYIIGIIGVVLSLATESLRLTDLWIGMIAAGSLAGILCGSLLSGFIVDRIGRKSIYNLTIWIFTIGAVLQFFVTSAEQLLALRLILGIAIGADYAVSISMVSELAPKRLRGRIMSTVLLAWVVGFSMALIIGVFLESLGEIAWRWALVSSVVPAAITLLIRAGTPESPLWLLAKGRTKEAQQVVDKHFGDDIALPVMCASPKSAGWSKLFSRQWRRHTFVGAAFYFCQVVPFFALGTFMPKIMESIKVDNPDLGGIIYSVFLTLGASIGLWVVDKFSRRAFLIGSFYSGAVTLLVLTLWLDMPPVLVIVLFSVFALILSGAQVLEYVYLPELFPTELRASGIGFSVAMSRIGGAGATFLLPLVITNYGVQVALGSCVAAMVLGGVICQLFAPEPPKSLAGTAKVGH